MQKLWVIRKQPYRETSALLTVLVEDNRLLRCIARGGGKVGEFQPWFGVFASTKTLVNLSKIEPAGARLPLQGIELVSGLYLNEITHWILPEGAEIDRLFDTYTECMKDISRGSVAGLRRFERFLLEAAGQYPVLMRDRSGCELRDDVWYRLHQHQELVEVNQGESDALMGKEWLALASPDYSNPATARYAKWLHRGLVDEAIGGRRLVSREMLSEIGKNK